VKTVSFQLPETAFTVLGKDEQEFISEMRIAAAVKWYDMGKISQGKAAEIAGLTRAEFIDALSRYQVCVFQYTEEDLASEMANVN